jgi:hypothetical protein
MVRYQVECYFIKLLHFGDNVMLDVTVKIGEYF